MRTGLWIAALLLAGIALAHSYLGERYILIRLLRRDNLPQLFGSDRFTERTLRFAWHVTSIAWLGFGAVLAVLAAEGPNVPRVLVAIAVTFIVTSLVIAVASRGRHLAWPLFLLVGILTWLAS